MDAVSHIYKEKISKKMQVVTTRISIIDAYFNSESVQNMYKSFFIDVCFCIRFGRTRIDRYFGKIISNVWFFFLVGLILLLLILISDRENSYLFLLIKGDTQLAG